jgi:putrescine transport system substrate-binding protein
MKSLVLAAFTAITVCSIHISPATAQEETLNLFSWADVYDEETLSGFTKTTGYKVRYDNYDSDEMLETKLLAGSSGYDLVTPSAIPFLQRQITAGAVLKFDMAKVPNAANIDPAILKLLKASDPELDHAVISAWGTTGMGLNPAKIAAVLPNAPLDSYDLMFKPENAEKLSKCGFAMVDSAADVVPIVVNYLGLDGNDMSKENVDKAMAVLDAIRPYVTYVDSSKYQIELANGSLCAVIGWSGDVVRAGEGAKAAGNGVALRYVVPKEGTLAWLTAYAIPADSSNPEAAFAFMNYMLDPKVAAHLAQVTGFLPPVLEARKYLPPEMANNDAMFPSEAIKSRLFSGSAQDEKRMRYVARQWARFRSGS